MAKKKKPIGGKAPGTWTVVTPDEISALRAKHHLSRQRLADMLDVSTTCIVNWESGRSIATQDSQTRVRSVLDQLANGVQPPPKVRPPTLWTPARGAAVEATGAIVTAYLTGAKVDPDELPTLIAQVLSALS